MIVTLVSFAFFFGILISRVGLPPMVGFLAAGFAYNFAGLETPEGLQPLGPWRNFVAVLDWPEAETKGPCDGSSLGTSVAHVVASTIFFAYDFHRAADFDIRCSNYPLRPSSHLPLDCPSRAQSMR